MKRTTYKIIFAALIVFLCSSCALADGGTVVTILPEAPTIAGDGTATLDVDISGAINVYAFQFDVDFGPTIVSATAESEGGFLPGGGTTFFIPGATESGGGVVSATADSLIGAIPGVSGNGTLAILQFTGLAPGTTSIDLANVILLDSNFDPINFTIEDASLTVKGGSTPVPEPSGVLLLGVGLIGLVGLARREFPTT